MVGGANLEDDAHPNHGDNAIDVEQGPSKSHLVSLDDTRRKAGPKGGQQKRKRGPLENGDTALEGAVDDLAREAEADDDKERSPD